MSATLIDFEHAPIDGASVESLAIEPLKKVTLRFLTFYRFEGDQAGGKQYEIHFAKIAAVRFQDFEIPAKVLSHDIPQTSDLLTSVAGEPRRYTAKIDLGNLRSFRITTDKGCLEVIAESAICLLIWDV